jgi:hypothetical protein
MNCTISDVSIFLASSSSLEYGNRAVSGYKGRRAGEGMGAQVTLVESARNGDEFFVGGGKNIEETGAGRREG